MTEQVPTSSPGRIGQISYPIFISLRSDKDYVINRLV